VLCAVFDGGDGLVGFGAAVVLAVEFVEALHDEGCDCILFLRLVCASLY
jgi:hypothetical protein